MQRLSLATILILVTVTIFGMPSWAVSEITRPHELHGLPLLQRALCTDSETGEQGVCFIIQGPDTIYMVFHHHNGPPRFLRRLNEDGTYSTIWHEDYDGPVPSGLPV